MADECYALPQSYYGSLIAPPFQPVNPLSERTSNLSIQHANSSYYTSPAVDFNSRCDFEYRLPPPNVTHGALPVSLSRANYLPAVLEDQCPCSEENNATGDMSPTLVPGAIPRYLLEATDAINEKMDSAFSLGIQLGLYRDSLLPAINTSGMMKHDARSCLNSEFWSSTGFANHLLIDSVYDTDFNVGSAIYSMPFADLENAVIGVEATAYLQQMIQEAPAHEPLLAALGGDPIGLKHHIRSELDRWQDNHMTPVFVFEGQSVVGKDDVTLRTGKIALERTEAAWAMYVDNKPDEAVKAFGASGAVRPLDLYRILQEVLAERNLEFIVAPFSACAQLAYMESLDDNYIDGVMGSRELLLYEKAGDAMIYPPTPANWENKVLTGIVKSELIAHLKVSPEMFADALLMVGTSFLPPFPPLLVENIISQQPHTLVDAINLLRTSEKSVTHTCSAFRDILDKQDPKWLDKYRKAKMLVKHCVTVRDSGPIIVRDYDNLTSDNVEYLGLQLPAELYHYLSKALIGPRLMNSFVSLELIVFPTLDGVVSDEYKRLVTQDLIKLKEETAALIASRIHRGFQFKDLSMKFWFDNSLTVGLTHRNIHGKINDLTDAWLVQDSDLKAGEKILNMQPGKISFALLALQNKDFAASTITKIKMGESEKSENSGKIALLTSKPEILSNALWRLLHIRKYVNDQHELTSWGKALAKTLEVIAPEVKKHGDVHHIEEAAILAFELIRFNNLISTNRHPELIGGPLRGSDADKASCLLIGRTSCLLKLRHDNIGYTGPLSKNFLSFHSLIKALREADRDLLEAIVAAMFLSNQANRFGSDGKVRIDFGDLGRSLPFAVDVDLSLGIAVKTYLDDFLKIEWSARDREANKDNYVTRFLPHSLNFKEDLDVAFKFFDAVYEGVMTLGDEMKKEDKAAWKDAKAYLDARR